MRSLERRPASRRGSSARSLSPARRSARIRPTPDPPSASRRTRRSVAYSKDCGKWPERQALGAQRGLRLRATKPGPEPGGQRRAVDLAVAQAAGGRARSRRRAAPAHRIDAAHDAGAAAERDDRDAARRRGLQHRQHLLGRTRHRRQRRARRRAARCATGRDPDSSCRPHGERGPRARSAAPSAAARVTASGSASRLGHRDVLELGARARLGGAELRLAASPGHPRQARAASRGRPSPTISSAQSCTPFQVRLLADQREVDPVERLVEATARCPAHHRRAEPREAAQALLARQAHLRGRRRPRARAGSRRAIPSGSARRGCRRGPASRQSARRFVLPAQR